MDAFIDVNCVLVAPVTLGAAGTIGGGSTITKNTEPGALTVAWQTNLDSELETLTENTEEIALTFSCMTVSIGANMNLS